jgi:hypothetical protein
VRIPQASPDQGPRKDCDHFSNWKGIKGGEKHTAYIAGPTQWVWMHTSDKGSKPCLYLLTNNTLPCKWCSAHDEPVIVGYQPVFREADSKAFSVIFYSEMKPALDALEFLDKVVIGREREKGSALWVRKCMSQDPPFVASAPYREREQDVGDSLLRQWGVPELSVWLKCGAVSDNAVSLDKIASSEVRAEEPADAHKPDAQPYTAPDAPADARLTDYPAMAARLTKGEGVPEPSPNGRHKPKK